MGLLFPDNGLPMSASPFEMVFPNWLGYSI